MNFWLNLKLWAVKIENNNDIFVLLYKNNTFDFDLDIGCDLRVVSFIYIDRSLSWVKINQTIRLIRVHHLTLITIIYLFCIDLFFSNVRLNTRKTMDNFISFYMKTTINIRVILFCICFNFWHIYFTVCV